MIKDSGSRTEFSTGAVRDIQEGKGRCDLMPLEVVADVLDDYVLCMLASFAGSGDDLYLRIALESFAGRAYGASSETMFLDVSIHYEEGAKKYGEYNWQKGIPVNRYIDSAVRHYLKWKRGDDDENHARAFVWNVMCCIWTIRRKDELFGEGGDAPEDVGEVGAL